ncbi:MAG TPA: ATP-binding protein [Polyangiaceae bacterium]|nr:ATP-binding protein [Polyangiaceae bacterium]
MDLVQAVRAVIEQNEPAARAKNLRVEAELDPAAGVVVADATRIRQVVWNLLSNAVKFTPEGGRVTVSLARTGDDVRIRISDTGAGIPPDFLPYIFDRFRQYEAAITRKYGGLGLGLTICKQLVEMHGGTIRAESAGANEGATFTVTLPMPAVRRQARRSGVTGEVSTNTRPLGGKTILLVEDDPATQDALGLVLQQAGASVKTASSGTEAVDLYRDFRPQIVLSDIGLPDTNGYRLLDRIRAFERDQKLPAASAVALTAYDREEDRRRAADAGFGIHLAKPIDADELVSVLATLALPE